MKKISILIPTRKRIESLKETLLNIEKQTKEKKLIEIIIGIDSDDQESKIFIEKFIVNIQIKIITKVMNRGLGYQDQPSRLRNMILSTNSDILMHFADDMKINTFGWDQILINKLKKLPTDKIFLLYPSHNQKNVKWPLVQIISKNWFYLTNKFSNCIEVDTELLIISTLLKRNYKIENFDIYHAKNTDQTFIEGRKLTLTNKILPNSVFSIKKFFLILMDYQILREALDNKDFEGKYNLKKNTFKCLKYYFFNFIYLFYYIYVIKKELKMNYIKYFFKNIYK